MWKNLDMKLDTVIWNQVDFIVLPSSVLHPVTGNLCFADHHLRQEDTKTFDPITAKLEAFPITKSHHLTYLQCCVTAQTTEQV